MENHATSPSLSAESVLSTPMAQSPQSPPPPPPPYTQEQMQHTLHLLPKEKHPQTPQTVSPNSPPPFAIQTFTSSMQPLDDLSRYPSYCLKDSQKDGPSHPISRARKIVDTGKEVSKGQECSFCLQHGQICIRAGGFSKCAYCTSEDLHPKGMCHLPGVEDPPTEKMSMTALSKKRKMDARTEEFSSVTKFGGGEGEARFQILGGNKRARGMTGAAVEKVEGMKVGRDVPQVPNSGQILPREPSPKLTSADPGVDSMMVKAMFEKIKALENKVSVLEHSQVKSGIDASTMTSQTPMPGASSNTSTQTLRGDDKDGNLDPASADIEIPDSEAETTTSDVSEKVQGPRYFWATVCDQRAEDEEMTGL